MKDSRPPDAIPNERYALRLCGPVLEGIGGWTEFVIFRSPDQLWSMEDGVKAGCVKVGMKSSGKVWGGWGWGRKCFEDAMAETGWWGETERKRIIEEVRRKEAKAGTAKSERAENPDAERKRAIESEPLESSQLLHIANPFHRRTLLLVARLSSRRGGYCGSPRKTAGKGGSSRFGLRQGGPWRRFSQRFQSSGRGRTTLSLMRGEGGGSQRRRR
jgi:hypothetical protein